MNSRKIAVVLSMLGLSVATATWAAPPANDYDRYSNDADRFGTRSTEPSGGGSAPFDERQVAVANARWAATKEIYSRTDVILNALPVQLRKAFETSTEYKTAANELAAAQHAIDAVQQPAMDKLLTNDEYRDNKSHYDRIAKILAAGHMSQKEVTQLSEQKLEYGLRMHRMEADALAGDPAVKQARTNLQEATAKVQTMRDNFETSVRTNPEFVAVRKAWADARVDYAAASGYLDGLVAARIDALNAFYAQQYYSSVGNVSSPYYVGPYNYGGYNYGR